MLSEAGAERLVRLALSDAVRGLPARGAWRLVLRAGDEGDRAVVAAVRRAWLREPRDDLWAALVRWRGRAASAEDAFVAALDPARSPGGRAAVVAFCARHDLSPSDDVRQALFFALTGQTDRLRAADPQGLLLAGAYQAASRRTRGALRRAMTSVEDFDPVRMVAGSPPARELSRDERAYVVGHLAGWRAWPALWRLVHSLPLDEAVAAVGRFDDGWRPPGDGDAALFVLLRRADPDAITRARRALTSNVIHLDLEDVPTHGALSPDGHRLLVATARGGLSVFGLPAGSPRERYDHVTAPPAGVVHLGAAFLVVAQGPGVWELVLYGDGGPRVVYRARRPIAAAALGSAGFVVVAGGERLVSYDSSGHAVREVALGTGPGVRGVAADPSTGRVAVYRPHLCTVDDGGELTSTTPPSPVTGACFPGQDRVVTTDESGHLRVYGAGLVPLADLAARACVDPSAQHLVAIPSRDEVAVLCRPRRGGGNGHVVRYFNAETLAPISHPRELAGAWGTALWACADGSTHAIGGRRVGGPEDAGPRGQRGFVRVAWGADPASSILDDSLSSVLAADDLGAVEAALVAPHLDPDVLPMLNLVRGLAGWRR